MLLKYNYNKILIHEEKINKNKKIVDKKIAICYIKQQLN